MSAREWCGAAALAVLPWAAAAEAPAPVGSWVSPTSGAMLVIDGEGACGFHGLVSVAGTCTWSPTSRGGILTLSYPLPLEPGRIYYSIVWIDRDAITVEGEEFRRH
jgi:hypothetical protein